MSPKKKRHRLGAGGRESWECVHVLSTTAAPEVNKMLDLSPALEIPCVVAIMSKKNTGASLPWWGMVLGLHRGSEIPDLRFMHNRYAVLHKDTRQLAFRYSPPQGESQTLYAMQLGPEATWNALRSGLLVFSMGTVTAENRDLPPDSIALDLWEKGRLCSAIYRVETVLEPPTVNASA